MFSVAEKLLMNLEQLESLLMEPEEPSDELDLAEEKLAEFAAFIRPLGPCWRLRASRDCDQRRKVAMRVIKAKKTLMRQEMADTVSNYVTFAFSTSGSTKMTSLSSISVIRARPFTSANILGRAALIAFVMNGLNSLRSSSEHV